MQRVVSRSVGTGALGVIEIPPGSTFQAYRLVVAPDGRVLPEPGTEYTWPEEGLTVQWGEALSGQYELGFLFESFGGTIGFDAVTVMVNNEDRDTTVKGFIDIEEGIADFAEWVKKQTDVVDLSDKASEELKKKNLLKRI